MGSVIRLRLTSARPESSSGWDARLQAIKVGLETPSWRAIRAKLRPEIRRRRNSLRVEAGCMANRYTVTRSQGYIVK